MAAQARKHRQQGTNAAMVRRQVLQRKFLRAHRHMGVVGPSLRAAGLGRNAYERWLSSDPSFAAAVELAEQEARDALLARLKQAAFKGDSQLLRFLARGLLPAHFGSDTARRAAQYEEEHRRRFGRAR